MPETRLEKVSDDDIVTMPGCPLLGVGSPASATITAHQIASLLDGPSCGHCGRKSDNLIRCQRCKFMQYCSKEHQKLHRPHHLSACGRLAKMTTLIEDAEACAFHPDRSLNDCLLSGQLSIGLDAQHMCEAYAESRVNVIKAMMAVKPQNKAMVQETLDYLHRSMQFGRHHVWFYHQACENLKPGLLVQISNDQEAYNMIKWCRKDYIEHASNRAMPWNVEDLYAGNLFEKKCSRQGMRFEHAIILVLLKVKILLDLRRLVATTEALGSRLPVEIVDHIRAYVPWISAIASNRQRTRANTGEWRWTVLQAMIRDLEAHIYEIAKSLRADDHWTWVALLDPERYFRHVPHTKKEAEKVPFKYSREAWMLIPGALEVMQEFETRMGDEPTE